MSEVFRFAEQTVTPSGVILCGGCTPARTAAAAHRVGRVPAGPAVVGGRRAHARLGGPVLARGRARMVHPDPEHFARYQRWSAEHDPGS